VEDLRQVGMGEDVHGRGELRQRLEVPAPDVFDLPALPDSRPGVDGLPVEPVDRPEQVVPRVRLEDLGKAPLPLTDEVDLDPELHRQPSLLGLEHGVAVGVEVVDAALALVRDLPQLARLAEVVDVLGEADLVDSAPAGGLDERLDRGDLVCDLLALVAKVHVVVDDHESHDSTSARSSASVIFSSRRSPGTTATRPPLASTREAQSDASPKSPANASRSTGAANACGVCTAT